MTDYGFDCRKLRGRIIEKYDNIEKFAHILGISPTTLSKKLSGKSFWVQDEIIHACSLLEIPKDYLHEYFFNQKVENIS